tara:strand:- start:5134 stop:5367 length:234 start_codon:yes stop_codon:yes gene_type:complete
MTEELKLLRAMCGALGLEVKREVIVTEGKEKRRFNRTPVFGQKMWPDWDENKWIGNGEYIEVKREVVYTVNPITNGE